MTERGGCMTCFKDGAESQEKSGFPSAVVLNQVSFKI